MKLLLILIILLPNFASGEEKDHVYKILTNKAKEITKQDVALNLDTFNISDNWALAFGELVSTTTNNINWKEVENCNNPEDKAFWAVLNKQNNKWRFVQLEICASEPPYWYLEDKTGLIWPCEIYKGLQAEPAMTLYKKCLKQK